MDKKNSINIKNIMGLIRINFKFILSIMTVLSLLSVIYSFVNEQSRQRTCGGVS